MARGDGQFSVFTSRGRGKKSVVEARAWTWTWRERSLRCKTQMAMERIQTHLEQPPPAWRQRGQIVYLP